MRWTIQLTTRADPKVSIEERHSNLMGAMVAIPKPFGLGGTPVPAAPDPGSSLSAICSLTRLIGAPAIFVNAIYGLRAPNYAPNDIFNLDYNAKRVSAQQHAALVQDYLPQYIAAFGACRLHAGSEQPFLDRSEPGSQRGPIRFIRSVNFWDAGLISEAFGKTSEQAMDILAPHAMVIRPMLGGVYSVLTGGDETPDMQWAAHEKLWALLKD
ncbi:hypothetical protein LJR118_004380 [Acidovorax sp. LjRoot118]|uniref:hypothetical protein n=1 Tax=unclassified Acidovorax TaxID=2684926 RepID=UPI000AD2FBF6|nr:hypothetical protein [Acidovorax sp. Root217]